LMLVPVSLLPAIVGISGRTYLFVALFLSLLFLASSIRAALSKSNQHARQLLLASVLYLLLLFGVMVVNRCMVNRKCLMAKGGFLSSIQLSPFTSYLGGSQVIVS